MHLKIAEQRMSLLRAKSRTAESISAWRRDDEHRSLDDVAKASIKPPSGPKADHIHYALAALDWPHRQADSAWPSESRHPVAPGKPLSARNAKILFSFQEKDPRFPSCSIRKRRHCASVLLGQALPSCSFFPASSLSLHLCVNISAG